MSLVTGQVAGFTERGVALASGEELTADIIVTATGLHLLALGGLTLVVDGAPVDLGDTVAYKGMMLCGVPNLAMTVGYTNASWTLRSDLTARLACRLLNQMKRRGIAIAVPREPGEGMERRQVIDFSSGYVKRAEGVLPMQGARHPWNVRQNYLRDLLAMRFSRIDEDLVLSTVE